MRKAERGHKIQIKYLLDSDLILSMIKDYSKNKGKVVILLFWGGGLSVCVNADRTGQLAPLFFTNESHLFFNYYITNESHLAN